MNTQFNAASIFAFFGTCTAFLTLFKQLYYQHVPKYIREYIDEVIRKRFNKPSILNPKLFTLIIKEYYGDKGGYGCYSSNGIYKACEAYLSTTLRCLSNRLEGCRNNVNGAPVSYHLAQGEEYVEYVRLSDKHNNVKLCWKFACRNDKGEEDNFGNRKSFELSFDPRYKDMVLDSFLPSVVLKKYDYMVEMKKEIHLHTFDGSSSRYCHWDRVLFNHPFTFDALALDPEMKKSIVDDLDMFLRRKEFYKKIGRAWKRGYLLYGPPGTGKSSLIAAIANYLKFNIYDLQLARYRLRVRLSRNASFNRESRDCYTDDEEGEDNDDNDGNEGAEAAPVSMENSEQSFSLSGLLNFIDGLWSSCGDERIIILTTNYKERLDPALLRPGRMDMHIHMSYLGMPGFMVLASNYLGLEEHSLFEKIEKLLETTEVSPAEVAEELIRSDDPDIALAGVVKMLEGKKLKQVSEKKKNKMKNKKGRNKAMKGKDKGDGEQTNQAEGC
ncbi:AAA-ATPase At3g50940-like [Beta vulgaris subsp. vulgaris]|uniref:AAA-ATPase At3g50940-like n=1 Tax=Beta vulgaris subsp. vulgaris TaxID=3555 RepID=UPI00203764FC|nr:AAA-ATPase At3g50940-like [Beta vulgaris subsp. vulgaris]